MNNSNALMARGAGDTWDVLVAQAQTLVKSKFLPAAIDTPEKAIAVMMTGQELGLQKMQALRQIVVINGKPTLSAELMLALIYRDHGDEAMRFVETTALTCTVEYRRKTWTKAERFSFTMEDARRAGLAGSQTWQKYPQALLRARCISAVARLSFPDTIGGMYTPEELGANVSVDAESGAMEVIDVTPTQAPQRALQEPQGDVVEGAYTEQPTETTARQSAPPLRPTPTQQQRPTPAGRTATFAPEQPAAESAQPDPRATALMLLEQQRVRLKMGASDWAALVKARNGGQTLDQLSIEALRLFYPWVQRLPNSQAATDFTNSPEAWVSAD